MKIKRARKTISVLFLGAKEFPFGASAATGEDAFPAGGIEAYVDALCRELAKNPSLRVTLVTRRFRGQAADEKLFNGRLRVLRVPWTKGFLLRNPSYNYAALRAARAARGGFDVVHAHGPVAAFLAPRLGKPVAATPHGVASGQPQYGALVRAALRAVERRAYARADCVVFLSGAERAAFREKLGFLPARSVVIAPGVDLARYSKKKNAAAAAALRSRLGLKEKFVVSFVGRLIAVKGVKFLIEAASLLEDDGVVFLVAGDGPERAALEAQARRLGVERRFFFLGERRDVTAVLAASDCFVLPSLSEGMPVALLEALAARTPCVVTRIGLPVRAGREALVVPPRNAQALASALARFARDSRLRKRIASNGFALAKEFSWTRAAARHAALYASLVR